MSWQDVKVKIEGAEYDGKMRGNEIFVPIMVEDAEPTIEVVTELQLVDNQNLNLKSYPKKYSQK